MNLIALGINHNSAAIELREQVAFAPEKVDDALLDACRVVGLDELVILSTCNRTELYGIAPEPSPAVEHLLQWMAGYHLLPADELQRCSYCHLGEQAVEHMVRVAAGLDSMVLGEPQIFGQLKSAFAVASDAGSVGVELGRLFPKVFSIAKKVRTDTAIGENPVSVAYAAVDLAGHIFADMHSCEALLVGAGETIELVAKHLLEAGVSRITIANRTLGRARDLAQQFGAEAVLLADIPEHLSAADIVITSTASQLPILGKGAVEQAIKVRKHRPMLMVDIAVPRDIEAQVGELRDIYLYTVDDLREIVNENLRHRQSEACKADEIISAGVAAYLQQRRSLGAVDYVREYRHMATKLRDQELLRAQAMLQRGMDADEVLSQLARSLTNKLIHAPTAGLKRASVEGRLDELADIKALLGLDTVAADDAATSPGENPGPVAADVTPGKDHPTLQ